MLLRQSNDCCNKAKGKMFDKNNGELSFKIQKERIDNVATAKYLGIPVDSNLNSKVISKLCH